MIHRTPFPTVPLRMNLARNDLELRSRRSHRHQNGWVVSLKSLHKWSTVVNLMTDSGKLFGIGQDYHHVGSDKIRHLAGRGSGKRRISLVKRLAALKHIGQPNVIDFGGPFFHAGMHPLQPDSVETHGIICRRYRPIWEASPSVVSLSKKNRLISRLRRPTENRRILGNPRRTCTLGIRNERSFVGGAGFGSLCSAVGHKTRQDRNDYCVSRFFRFAAVFETSIDNRCRGLLVGSED